jgi:hypothetical protein
VHKASSKTSLGKKEEDIMEGRSEYPIDWLAKD